MSWECQSTKLVHREAQHARSLAPLIKVSIVVVRVLQLTALSGKTTCFSVTCKVESWTGESGLPHRVATSSVYDSGTSSVSAGDASSSSKPLGWASAGAAEDGWATLGSGCPGATKSPPPAACQR